MRALQVNTQTGVATLLAGGSQAYVEGVGANAKFSGFGWQLAITPTGEPA